MLLLTALCCLPNSKSIRQQNRNKVELKYKEVEEVVSNEDHTVLRKKVTELR